MEERNGVGQYSFQTRKRLQELKRKMLEGMDKISLEEEP